MVELRNGKQADQAGIHQQPTDPQTYFNHADAKRKDSLAHEHGNGHGDGQQPVSNVDAGDDLPRILEEIGAEERRLEMEQKEKQEQKGKAEEGGEGHQPLGQLSLPREQDHGESEQSIPQKRAHSDIALLNFDDDEIDIQTSIEDEGRNEYHEEQPSVDMGVGKDPQNEQKQEPSRETQGERKTFGQGGGPSLGPSSNDENVPIQPPDRRPTPGRINNPRAVNEESAAPVFSRGVVEDFPWKTDPNYSRRTYLDIDAQGRMSDFVDAPQEPPTKKGRYNNLDRLKWEEEQPMADPNRMSHPTHLCASRGPDGPPTYDQAGYLLDYEKCLKWAKPSMPSMATMVNDTERRLERHCAEHEQMAKLFFEPGAFDEKHTYSGEPDHWRDRVSKDLGVPWHAVGVEQFEEWDRQGFPKAKKGEYRKFEEAERERMLEMHSGSALRVGSKN